MRLLKSAILVSLLFFAFSCKKTSVDPPADYLLKRGLSIYYRDHTTNASLIGYNGEPFDPDSIKIYKQTTAGIETLGSALADSIGEYSCNFIYLLSNVSREEDIQVITLDLSVFIYFNQFRTDTVAIQKETFSDIKVYRNHHLLERLPALLPTFPYPITIKE